MKQFASSQTGMSLLKRLRPNDLWANDIQNTQNGFLAIFGLAVTSTFDLYMQSVHLWTQLHWSCKFGEIPANSSEDMFTDFQYLIVHTRMHGRMHSICTANNRQRHNKLSNCKNAKCHLSLTLKPNVLIYIHTYTVSRKITWCQILAVTSSTVNQFWKSFHWWKQQ